jgi:hypothetical protein
MDANNAKSLLIMEIKLATNQSLFDKKIITEDMYRRAKDIIVKQSA